MSRLLVISSVFFSFCTSFSIFCMDPSFDFSQATISKRQENGTITLSAANHDTFFCGTFDGKLPWSLGISYVIAIQKYQGSWWDNTRPAGDQHCRLSAEDAKRYYQIMLPVWESRKVQWNQDCAQFER